MKRIFGISEPEENEENKKWLFICENQTKDSYEITLGFTKEKLKEYFINVIMKDEGLGFKGDIPNLNRIFEEIVYNLRDDVAQIEPNEIYESLNLAFPEDINSDQLAEILANLNLVFETKKARYDKGENHYAGEYYIKNQEGLTLEIKGFLGGKDNKDIFAWIDISNALKELAGIEVIVSKGNIEFKKDDQILYSIERQIKD